jgi:hypothetical protein
METQPDHLKSSHEGLRAILRRAAREPGNTGATARKVAAIVAGEYVGLLGR